jgi:hypothetical protein
MMSGTDERDPLDSWLSQQVHPLPPPPGTFELITRRARRRKLRRLAVTVASAAAVAAAVAVAVPNVIALNLTPSPVPASVAAGQGSASPSGTQQPESSASRHTSPSPSPSHTSPASQTSPPRSVTPPGGPVPSNFRPVSITFVNRSTAWVIGQAGMPGTCANPDPNICTSIARTDDTGKTWRGEPAPATTGPFGAEGVSGLRFLDGVNGWAFGPELWATHDAGQNWTQVNTNGKRVTDLEAAGNRAFALWATCSGGGANLFAANCTSYTLMTASANGGDWTPVGAATTGLSNGGTATSGMLALTSTTGYLLAPDGALYSGPIGGASWQKVGTAPCQPGPVQNNGQPLPANALLAVAPSATVVLACVVPGGVHVSTSADGGLNWDEPAADAWIETPPIGTPTSLAAAPDGRQVLATTNGIYVLPAGGSQWKQATVEGTPYLGFTYVGMTTATQGVALPADTSLHKIWMTFDGGLTWAARTQIGPGN